MFIETARPATARATAARPASPHPVALRVGLVLAAVLAVAAVPPAVDVGLDGSGWDVVVVVLAVVAPAVAVASLVLLPLAWHGRRGPSTAVVAVQLLSVLTAVPPLVLVATGELPAVAAAGVGAVVLPALLACWLVARGRAPRRPCRTSPTVASVLAPWCRRDPGGHARPGPQRRGRPLPLEPAMDPLGLGLVVGLASAAPLGPQNAYLLQVGLQLPTARAWGAAALVVGLDVSVSLAGAGLAGSALAGAPHLRAPALVVGTAVLLLMGAQVLWRARGPLVPAVALPGAAPGSAAPDVGWTARRMLLGALAVTWLNPVALLDSTLLFGGLAAATRAQDLPVLMTGMCAASALWTGGLLLVLRAVRARVADRARRWLERAAGAVVVLVGLRLAAQAAGVA